MTMPAQLHLTSGLLVMLMFAAFTKNKIRFTNFSEHSIQTRDINIEKGSVITVRK